VPAELRAIRERLDELEKRDKLVHDVKALGERVDRLQSEEIVQLRIEVHGLIKTKPAEKVHGPWSFVHFEELVTPRRAIFLFLFFFVPVLYAGYGYYKNPGHITAEYISYVCPIIAAIFAGLTVYKDHLKGRLFVISLIFLFLGLDAFIAFHELKEIMILKVNLAVEGLLVLGLLISGIKAATKARSVAGNWSFSTLGAASLALLGPWLFAFGAYAAGSYFVAFYLHDRPCLPDFSGPDACPGDQWPPLSNTLWPWPEFYHLARRS